MDIIIYFYIPVEQTPRALPGQGPFSPSLFALGGQQPLHDLVGLFFLRRRGGPTLLPRRLPFPASRRSGAGLSAGHRTMAASASHQVMSVDLRGRSSLDIKDLLRLAQHPAAGLGGDLLQQAAPGITLI